MMTNLLKLADRVEALEWVANNPEPSNDAVANIIAGAK